MSACENQTKEFELFQEMKQGSNKAFNYFFDKYYQGLCVYAYKLTDSRTGAEDIVQDFFVRLWENRKKTELRTKVKSYFLRSIHNRSLDYIAHKQVKENHRAFKQMNYTDDELMDYPIVDFELKQKIDDAINNLPDSIRETFILNRFEGLSYKEIAQKENISVKTVEYRVSKAIAALRISLKDYLHLILFL